MMCWGGECMSVEESEMNTVLGMVQDSRGTSLLSGP